MMAPIGDLQDHLLKVASVTTVAVSQISSVRLWHMMHAIIAQIRVTAAAVGAGDSLAVVVRTSPDQSNWYTLLSFTVITGTQSVPYTESVSVIKSGAQAAWWPFLQVVATPAGGTANFTIGDVIVVGS